MTTEMDRIVRELTDATRVVVLTGAGMSQESGVPTFRDALTGLWSRYDPAELATPEAFARDPARVFGWYHARWRTIRRTRPHAGHQALVDLREAFEELVVVTQNVDGLHRRSGSADVIELHGSLDAFRCVDRGHPYEDIDHLATLSPDADGLLDPPRCSACGSAIRPSVVWFGEVLPPDAVQRAWAAAGRCDVMLVVGTSSVVYPAALLPQVATAAGARAIEINPEPTPLTTQATLHWSARAGVALPQLAARLVGRRRAR